MHSLSKEVTGRLKVTTISFGSVQQ